MNKPKRVMIAEIQEETEHLNGPITSKLIEFLIKKIYIPSKKLRIYIHW